MKKIILTILLCSWATVAFAASISTLTDNFNDNSIDAAKWTTEIDIGGTILETNQEIEFTTGTSGTQSYLYSATTYDLTGSQATIKIVDVGNTGITGYEFYPLSIWKNLDINNTLNWEIYPDGNIWIFTRIASVNAWPWNATYVANTFRYLKIREASGTIYFDYSSNGINWTNAYSLANPFTITSTSAVVSLYSGADASTTTAKVDNFNILPSGEETAPTYSHAFNNGFNSGFQDGVN